eukprot:210867_1
MSDYQQCCLCESVRDMIEFGEKCYIETRAFKELLVLDDSDFITAKESCGRLDKVKPIPNNFAECNNVQKRIVLYYKIFCNIWTDVFTRKTIPLCIAASGRVKYPNDIINITDDIDDRFCK